MADDRDEEFRLQESEAGPPATDRSPVGGYPVLVEKTPEPRRLATPLPGKLRAPAPRRSGRFRILRLAVPLVLLLFFLGLSMIREPLVSRLPERVKVLKHQTLDRVVPLPPRKDAGSARVQKGQALQLGPRAEPLPPGMFRLMAVGPNRTQRQLDSLRKCYRPAEGHALQLRTRSPLSFSHVRVEFCAPIAGQLPGVPDLKAETGDGFQHKYTRLVPDSSFAVIDLDGEMSDRITLSTTAEGQFPGFVNIIPYVFVR